MAAAIAAGLVAGCARSGSEPEITLILHGLTAITLASTAAPEPVAIGVGGDRIVAVGNEDSVARWRRSGATVIGLDGSVVAPALVDHHVHLYNVGLALLNAAENERLFLDLSRVTSLGDLEARVAGRARETPPAGWVLGSGWSQGAWKSRALPDESPLSRAAPDRPVFLSRIDGHAGWANRRALDAAGLSAESADPPGGVIVRAAGGRPSGMLLERANEAVARVIPALSDDDVIRAFRMAADSLAARGVVEVFDAGALAHPGVVALNADLGRLLDLLRRADSAAPLPIRINLMIPAPSRLADSILALPADRRIVSPRIRITHLKLFADGALGSRGAALSHPYRDDPATSGVPRMTATEITAVARSALGAGLGVATHAIGDLAVTRTLDAYETILRGDSTLDPGRLRIEHFSYASDSDFERAVRLGVVLSIQSNFNALPDESSSLGTQRVGSEAEPRVYAWNRLFGMGAKLAEGSDYFGLPAGPLASVAASLTRRYAVAEGRPDPGARLLAWRLNARRFPPSGPAVEPAIRPGSPADLVILSADPTGGSRARLDSIRVLATMNRGRFSFLGLPPHLTAALGRR